MNLGFLKLSGCRNRSSTPNLLLPILKSSGSICTRRRRYYSDSRPVVLPLHYPPLPEPWRWSPSNQLCRSPKLKRMSPSPCDFSLSGAEVAWYADGDCTVRNEFNSEITYGFSNSIMVFEMHFLHCHNRQMTSAIGELWQTDQQEFQTRRKMNIPVCGDCLVLSRHV